MKLKDVIEKGYEEFKTANLPRITNLKEIATKQCCRYDGDTKYSTKFQRWVDTKSVILLVLFTWKGTWALEVISVGKELFETMPELQVLPDKEDVTFKNNSKGEKVIITFDWGIIQRTQRQFP